MPQPRPRPPWACTQARAGTVHEQHLVPEASRALLAEAPLASDRGRRLPRLPTRLLQRNLRGPTRQGADTLPTWITPRGANPKGRLGIFVPE